MGNPKLTFEPTKSNPTIYIGKCDHPECKYANKKGALPGNICHRGAKATESLLNVDTELPHCSGSSDNWHPISRLISEDSKALKSITYEAEMKAYNEVR